MGKKAKPSPAAPATVKRGGLIGKAYGLAEKFEQLVNTAAAPLPSPRVKMWLSGFFRPEETYGKGEKGATFLWLAGNLVLFYAAYALIFFIFMLAITSLFSAGDLLAAGIQRPPDLAQEAFNSLAIGPIASAFSALFMFGLVFLGARALGGKGTYVKQANSMALVLCGSSVVLLALMLAAFAAFLPSFALRNSLILGTAASLAALVINAPIFLLCLAILLYSIYAYFLVVKKAHAFSGWRAAGAMLIAIALLIVIDFAVNAMIAAY